MYFKPLDNLNWLFFLHVDLTFGVWLRVAKQFLSCPLVRGRGVVFRHYYKSIAKCAGKDYRDGAVVPFE